MVYFPKSSNVPLTLNLQQLNRLNVSLFTPALLFSKVAFFLSPEKLRELWIIPLFFVIVTLASMSVAFVLGWIFRLRKSQRSFGMAAAMFMNSNSLPIALMQSLVLTVPGLKWGEDDNNDAMLGRALTYLVLYSTLGMVLRWSYGVRLLAQADDEPQPIALPPDNEDSPLFGSSSSDEAIPHIVVEEGDATVRGHPSRRRSRFYNSFPNSPNDSHANLSSLNSSSSTVVLSPEFSDSEMSDDELETNVLPTHHERQHTRTQLSSHPSLPVLHRVKWDIIPDLDSSERIHDSSLIVACIQPLQHALGEHMQPVKNALASAGNCSIPLTLIVLGAYFYPSQEDKAKTESRSLIHSMKGMFTKRQTGPQQEETQAGETKTVIIAVASRMIITPLLLLPLMALSTILDWHSVLEDPVFVVANVLLISSPPALTLAQITQAASGDAFERLISRTIFWAYCVVTPPATVFYVVIGLILSKL
ncbi:membrane transport protein-domain-containing protein [Desarmillaria ectypa]|nr:membrane transport protein-domain-containing protein [Desarmillaria ectypa]